MSNQIQEFQKSFTIDLHLDHGCMMRGAMEEELASITLQGKVQIKVNIHSPYSYTSNGPVRSPNSKIQRVKDFSLEITPENKDEKLEELLDEVCGKLNKCCGPDAED